MRGLYEDPNSLLGFLEPPRNTSSSSAISPSTHESRISPSSEELLRIVGETLEILENDDAFYEDALPPRPPRQ